MPAGPVTLYAQWTPDECTIKLDEFRVAFEDIPWGKWSGGNCKGDNDFDYEDCVADVEVEGTLIGGLLSQIKFTVDYIHNGAVGLDHKFGLLMPAAFKNQIETAQLNDIDYGAFPADGRFIIFKKGDPGGIYELILTFKSAINYDYYGFDPD